MVLVEEHSCTQKLLPVYLAIEAIEHPSKAGYKMNVFIPQLYTLCQEVCRYIGMRENCMWPVSLSFSSPSVEWGQAFPEPNSIMIFFISSLKLLALYLPLSNFDIHNFLYHPTIPALIWLKQDLDLAQGFLSPNLGRWPAGLLVAAGFPAVPTCIYLSPPPHGSPSIWLAAYSPFYIIHFFNPF